MTPRNNKRFSAIQAENALWLVGIGLMLASSGIDGAYMARWMPEGLGWLGLVLNTVSDVAGMALMFAFGRLRRENARTSKKYKMAAILLLGEFVAAFYAWLFGWRQLRLILVWEEEWVAPVAAAFMPILLALIGWAQALIVEPAAPPAHQSDANTATASATGANEAPVVRHRRATGANEAPPVRIQLDEWREWRATLGREAPQTVAEFGQWCAKNGYKAPAASTIRRWLKETSDER